MKRYTAKLPTSKKQAGFTLIELIMVIVILGVLSAFALPRFADLGGEARTASINGLAGALRSAANIAHAQQLAEGLANNANVTLEGTAIAMSNGYPTTTSIALAAQVLAADYTNTNGVFTITGFTPAAGSQCQVTYTAATASGATPPVITAPTVVAVTGGC
ncbi:type II secretion system protein [Bacterioplanoides sp.]|uniref:type II secretion system protein n=1 Tax=Bacterioplanoides sp. TaxID=2066072 RepID=UPI003B00636E